MTTLRYTKHAGVYVPTIKGAKGGKGSKGGGNIVPNSLFATDIVFLTVGLSEGPVYRINPNGPLDIEISDNSIDDLINLDTDGGIDTNKFNVAVAYGTTTQDPLYLFGDAVVTPQGYSSPVKLRKGNISGIPESKVLLQETSAVDWDSIRFNFVVDQLYTGDKNGDIFNRTVRVRITVFNFIGDEVIGIIDTSITGKTDTPYKKTIQYNIPTDKKSESGYKFTVEKVSDDSDDQYIGEEISFFGWDEVKNTPQAYPRTAVAGYALKAVSEYTGGIPTFTSLVKGMLVKVPSNYNQPILENGEIDWRQLEVAPALRNLYSNSENFASTDWVKTNATISSNTFTAYTGASTADTLTATDALNHYHIQRSNTAVEDNESYAFSSFFKKTNRDNIKLHIMGGTNYVLANVNLTQNSADTGSITTFDNGWVRVSGTAIADAPKNILVASSNMVGGLWPNSFSSSNVAVSKLRTGIDVDNLPFADYSVQGTANVNSFINLGINGGITPAVLGDTFTGSMIVRLIGGTQPPADSGARMIMSGFTSNVFTDAVAGTLGITANTDTYTTSNYTVTNPLVNGVYGVPQIVTRAGVTANYYIRIKAAQFERGSANTAYQHNFGQANHATPVNPITTAITIENTKNIFNNSRFIGFTPQTIATSITLGEVLLSRTGGSVPSLEITNVDTDEVGEYIDIRVFGTNSTAGTAFYQLTSPNPIRVAPGYQVTVSADLQVISDVGLNTPRVDFYAHWLNGVSSLILPVGISVPISSTMQRFVRTPTAAPVNVDRLGNRGLFIAVNAGQVVDFTLRVRRLQVELGATETAYEATDGTTASVALWGAALENSESAGAYQSTQSLAPYRNSYTTTGYRLQQSGTDTVLYNPNPAIYTGAWDGTFVYSWTQNPAWIVYDLLTNKTYGLGIPEENIDKYKFYQVGMYCDACNSRGRFIGVDALADGSFRYKPNGQFTRVRESQIGLAKGTVVGERRFILDISIADQEKSLDILNKLTSTFRSLLVYSGGKITLAADMPDEYPVMLFNDANIKQGSLRVSGVKESEIFTGVDIAYVEPTNHYKREDVRVDLSEIKDGTEVSPVEYIANIDMPGVTRRSQAMRAAQYYLAASRYQKRNITFETGAEATSLSPGDVISVASRSSGVTYGYSGKVSANSLVGSANVAITLEHFTNPAISNEVFTNNTFPIALRIVKPDTERTDLYILNNTNFATSATGLTGQSIDKLVVNPISRFNQITKTFTPITNGFSANLVPQIGDYWSLGEIERPSNYYTNKSDKLFKVTATKRDERKQTITVSAVEYISNIYVDSDSFINYEPTSYVDLLTPFAAPPVPRFSFTARPVTRLDGTVAVDGIITDYTDKVNYQSKIETDYYIATPSEAKQVVDIISGNPITVIVDSANNLINNTVSATITGKNGFSSAVGNIKLLCNNISLVGLSNIVLTVEGLSSCIDDNFNKHVLAVNDGVEFGNLKGIDKVVIPTIEKQNNEVQPNFVGFLPTTLSISRDILSYNDNTIVIDNAPSGGSNLLSRLPAPPFYVLINQVLAKNYYSNNSFYLDGTSATNIVSGDLIPNTTNTIELPAKPVHSSFVTFYVDGVKKFSGFTVNNNRNLSIKANIVYTPTISESIYRAEVESYTVPTIEVGDTVQIAYNNVFTVVGTSYETSSNAFSNALTSNNIFKIILDDSPSIDASGLYFTNITRNPSGVLNNVTSNSFTVDYSSELSSNLNLASYGVYSVNIDSNFERLFLTNDRVIKDLPVGITSIKARNRNSLGRVSAFAEQSVLVEELPIQKVQNIVINESLYREQTSGVAVRCTVSFDHIIGQEVTDYEISYRLNNIEDIGSDDGGSGLASFNTVKVPAIGVDDFGRISFTINNINRGVISSTNSIDIRITPLNKSIRGITAFASKTIIGKTAPPKNIFNFVGGQQTDQITFLWSYARVNDELEDLDLKEVIIRRLDGAVDISEENFLAAQPLVIVSAGSVRKSIPIDNFSTYTYLAKTRDTSGNFSTSTVGFSLTTTRPQRNTIVAAYNEDSPTVVFAGIPNSNTNEFNYPSFANSNTSGISYSYTSSVDNANGSSSGWSTTTSADDLLAVQSATYTTQIRDFGQVVVGQISIEITGSQEIQTTYNDLHEDFIESVSDVSANASILVDTSFGGIGHILGFNNVSVTAGRYDSNNRTWMTGPVNGNVWGIWNDGQFIGDTANANSYALIAGLINANAIALGETYFANGNPTGSNAIANITAGSATYTLVNFTQYNDTGAATFAGEVGVVSNQVFVRTSTADNVYYANGNVNISTFDGYTVNEGFLPYEAGTKVFRHFQIKYVVNNSKPDEYNFTLDKLRYTIDKEQTVYSNTVVYDSSPKTVDFTSAGYLTRPVITYAVLDQLNAEANPSIVITTAASNTSVSFKLIASNGTGEYPPNSTANVMLNVVGV